jgi:hypothetical protein
MSATNKHVNISKIDMNKSLSATADRFRTSLNEVFLRETEAVPSHKLHMYDPL